MRTTVKLDEDLAAAVDPTGPEGSSGSWEYIRIYARTPKGADGDGPT
jgi:hypothetical protein